MNPRPYDLGRRQDQIDENRRRVLDAARALLAESSTYTAFTVEAVAKRADVARATVYYQFRSKTGILEGLCDSLAEAGNMAELANAFTEPDPLHALARFIAVFGRFWTADRLVTRRLRALAALDADVGTVISARDNRNRTGLEVLVGRIAADTDITMTARLEDAVRVLHTLTRFETFDSLAGDDKQPSDVVPVVTQLAEAALGVSLTGRHSKPKART
jgi:AcrR family transcriptional regulator